MYLSLTVYGGPDDGHWTTRIVSAGNDRTLHIADDGTFDVVLSPQRHPGNWLALDPMRSTWSPATTWPTWITTVP